MLSKCNDNIQNITWMFSRSWDQQKAITKHYCTEELLHHHRNYSRHNEELFKKKKKLTSAGYSKREQSRTNINSLCCDQNWTISYFKEVAVVNINRGTSFPRDKVSAVVIYHRWHWERGSSHINGWVIYFFFCQVCIRVWEEAEIQVGWQQLWSFFVLVWLNAQPSTWSCLLPSPSLVLLWVAPHLSVFLCVFLIST